MEKMISVQEAQKIIGEQVSGPLTETVLLADATDRILTEDIQASFPMPRFDNSAMDGFAVRAIDTKGASTESPVFLELVGVVPAGSPGLLEVGPGQCVQCMTGAPIPKGADAIVMVENSSGFDNGAMVRVFLEAKAGKHIRWQGEEIRGRDILIAKGTRITPAELGTLATFGFGEVSVFQRPRVAIFATGDELVEPGQDLQPGQIYNSNLFVLADLVKRAGAEVVYKQVIRDDPKSLRDFMDVALRECQLVISTGGVSMGRYDYVRKVLLELKVREHFWKVAQKPGKPLFFGTVGQTLIFGLPGNPVSAFIGFMEYVWSVIEHLSGIEPAGSIEAHLVDPFPREMKKHRFLFGKAWLEQGRWMCKPSVKLGSHMLTSGLEANCIIGVSPGNDTLKKGAVVTIRLLPWKK